MKFHDKSLAKVTNGSRGVIEQIHEGGAVVRWKDDVRSTLSNDQLRFVDHTYARTSFKEQGATNDREIIALSLTGAKVFNRESAYVAVSRARDNTEIVTSDSAAMVKNAGKDVGKTTALEPADPRAIFNARREHLRDKAIENEPAKRQVRGQTLSL